MMPCAFVRRSPARDCLIRTKYWLYTLQALLDSSSHELDRGTLGVVGSTYISSSASSGDMIFASAPVALSVLTTRRALYGAFTTK